MLAPNDGIDSFIQYAFDSKVIDAAVGDVMKSVVAAALGLSAILFALNIAYNYGSTALRRLNDKNVEFLVDYAEIGRVLVIIACISVYPGIADLISVGINKINASTAPTDNQMSQQGKNVKEIYRLSETDSVFIQKIDDQIKKTSDKEDIAKLNSMKDKIKSGKLAKEDEDERSILQRIADGLNPKIMVADLINNFFKLTYTVVRIIVSFFALNIFKVLICLGPLAFAFSILPAFKNQISIWFGTTINVGLVFTAMNIIDHLVYATTEYVKNSNGGLFETASNFTSLIAFNATMTILYLMCFWLTSKVVGKGDAGGVLSKAVGIAGAGVGAAVSMTSSAATTVSNASNSGKDVIKG